ALKKSRDAKKKRQQQSAVQREERLAGLRQQKNERTAMETDAQREERLAGHRQQEAERRATETDAQREERNLETELVRRSDALQKPKSNEELEWKPSKFAVEECRLAERIIRPEAPAHNCGPMDRACDQCGALLWCSETRNFCCAKGKVKLPSRTVPQVLADLYLGRHRMSAEFLTNIRSYNSALHLTSLGAKLRLVPGWCPSFIISGQLHHNTAPLFAEDSAEPHGWQVYFNDRELESRQSLSQKVKPELLELCRRCFTSATAMSAA
uniref:Helitron_like_N domain-containing protein n=1 Tax=Macrostomum lignano TaxID=282301 RepID=A0A1I8FT16_9PLAT